MKRAILGLGIIALFATTGCSADNAAYVAKLKRAVESTDVTLADSMVVAESDQLSQQTKQAALMVNIKDFQFHVRTHAAEASQRYEIDLDGAIADMIPGAQTNALCSDVTAVEAIGIAEALMNGEAVAIEEDDDGFCALEIQVLAGSTLWEVELGAQGQLLEIEESDEGAEDDDDDDGDDDD